MFPCECCEIFNPYQCQPTEWSNTPLSLSVFDFFVGFALEERLFDNAFTIVASVIQKML